MFVNKETFFPTYQESVGAFCPQQQNVYYKTNRYLEVKPSIMNQSYLKINNKSSFLSQIYKPISAQNNNDKNQSLTNKFLSLFSSNSESQEDKKKEESESKIESQTQSLIIGNALRQTAKRTAAVVEQSGTKTLQKVGLNQGFKITHNLRSIVTSSTKNIPLKNDYMTKSFTVSQPLENVAKLEQPVQNIVSAQLKQSAEQGFVARSNQNQYINSARDYLEKCFNQTSQNLNQTTPQLFSQSRQIGIFSNPGSTGMRMQAMRAFSTQAASQMHQSEYDKAYEHLSSQLDPNKKSSIIVKDIFTTLARFPEYREKFNRFSQKQDSEFNVNPRKIKIVEVSPRDGLQNEKNFIDTHEKIELINKLSNTGLTAIEATSFVSPKAIPQLKDNQQLFMGIDRLTGISYPVLVPNEKGMEAALKCGVKEIAVFGAASEKFTQKNINCSIEESLKRFEKVIDMAKKNNIKVRGYVSTVMGCPYQGEITPAMVYDVSKQLLNMGCYEISLGDTIGIGTPQLTKEMISLFKKQDAEVGVNKIAAHFHDTYQRAIPNLVVALAEGIDVVDSSVAGIGGCPYAGGKASGNVPTEDVIYMIKLLGLDTAANAEPIIEAGEYAAHIVCKDNLARVNKDDFKFENFSKNRKILEEALLPLKRSQQ